jgi:hypothetical protein
MVYNDDAGANRRRRPKGAMHQFDRQKFKALIHYVISRCPPERVGRTKLNKAGFLADMLWYLQAGHPMTGETYVKQNHGPVAEHLLSSLRELLAEGALEERLVTHFGFSKFEYIARSGPDLSRFSDDEKAVVDDVAEFVCLRNTARSISEFSHSEAWRSARAGEELPYFAATELLDAEVDEGDVAWASEELQRLGRERPKYREVRGKSIRAVCSELYEAGRRLRT